MFKQIVVAVAAISLLAACGGSSDSAESSDAPTRDTVVADTEADTTTDEPADDGADEVADTEVPSDSEPTSGADDLTTFCAEYIGLEGERPESYVGSQEHLSDIDGLLAVAPEAVSGDISIFRDYLASGAIDSEGDPDSNLISSFPAEVQASLSSIQDFALENC